jgi:hypothetical protein
LIRRGGCIGDYGNNPKNPAADGQLSCPSSGSADWGTVFQQVADNLCPKGYAVYWNNHNLGYVGFYHEGNGYQVYLEHDRHLPASGERLAGAPLDSACTCT